MAFSLWQKRRGNRASVRRRRLQCEQLEPRLVLADKGLYLDGTGDHLQISQTPIPVNQMTIEAWIFRHDAGRCEEIAVGQTIGSFEFWLCDGARLKFASNNNGFGYQTAATPIPAYIWTHVAVTWKHGERLKFYVNGDLDGNVPAGPAPLPAFGNDTVAIGAWLSFTGQPSYEFRGMMSEVRLWDVERSQNDIRHTMNVALDEKLPGLVFDLHLRDNFADSARGLTVANYWNAQIVASNPPTPALPPVAAVDANFNTITIDDIVTSRYAAGTAYLPSTNRALLVGGISTPGVATGQIMTVDLGSGRTSAIGQLPVALYNPAAAYASVNDRVYVFGGRSGVVDRNSIYRVDPTTGVSTLLAATLPTGAWGPSAVYHPRLNKIVVMGGWSGSNTESSIHLFDSVTESLTTLPFTMSGSRMDMAAVYSAATDRIYGFGGRELALPDPESGSPAIPTNTILQIELSADGTSGSATTLAARLPTTEIGQGAFEDPRTRMIYIMGGESTEHVLAFDPLEGRLWRTTIRLPRQPVGNNGLYEGLPLVSPYASVVYSPQNRHALVIGGQGNNQTGFNRTSIWRVPLGAGAAVPLERWDFPTPIGVPVNAIDGNDNRVVFGTSSGGVPGGTSVVEINADGSRFALGSRALGGTHDFLSINDVKYDSGSDRIWVAAGEVGVYRFPGNSTAWDDHVGAGGGFFDITTNRIHVIDYGGSNFGSDDGLWAGYRFGPGYLHHFSDPAAARTHVEAVATSPITGETWGVTRTQGPGEESPFGPPQVRRLQFDDFGFGIEMNFASVCGVGTSPGELSQYKDMAFDPSGNLWIVGTGRFGVEGNLNDKAICYIPHDNLPAGAQRFFSYNGEHAVDVDIDAEGRVWMAFQGWNGSDGYGVESGGLTVWESNLVTGTTTTDYNWQNAPIGSRRLLGNFGGYAPIWDSGYTAVTGADEKVWASRGLGGELATVAQRWQQADYLSQTVVNKVFTARGRTFFASNFSLYVLQPDGLTWDTRILFDIKTVFADSRGNTWVGAGNGVQLYVPSGWDLLADRAGTRPTGQIHAIVESRDENTSDANPGPIWIGGQNGLTLFDRNRFVATFTPANSGLPSAVVKALLVDRQNRLWVGTDAGLAILSADRATWTTFTTANGLPNNSVFELAEMGDGRIAISTANGLSFYNGATFATQTPPVAANNLPLTVDEGGRLWAGSAVLTANGWKGYWYTNSGLKHSTISDNAADGGDRVWFSHAPNPGVSVRGAYLPPLKDAQPTISSFSPRYATSGQNLAILGNTFGGRVADVDVRVGDSKVEIVSIANTRVDVRVADDTRSGPISLTRGGRSVSYGADATNNSFCAVPHVTSFAPTGANVGVEVTVTGTNFDSDAVIRIGSGAARKPHVVSPTEIRWIVQSTDTSGAIRIDNHCAGATATSGLTFRKINLSVSDVVLNQGMSAYGIIEEKPTLVQTYIDTGGPLSLGNRVEVDEVLFTITGPDGIAYRRGEKYPSAVTPAFLPAPPSEAQRRDINASLNVANIRLLDPGQTQVTATLYRRGFQIAERSVSVNVQRNQVTRVLLIPVLSAGNLQAKYSTIRGNVAPNLGELRDRIMPFGTVEFEWSPEVVIADGAFDLGDALKLYHYGHGMDRARRHWNESHFGSQVQMAFGLVEPALVASGSATGFAFWNDVSQILNIPLGVLDALCDFGDDALEFFGLSDGEGCQLDIPTYVGWAIGGPTPNFRSFAATQDSAGNLNANLDGVGAADGADDMIAYAKRIAGVITHEMGHVLGLVKPFNFNGSYGDNLSHSVNDEIGGSATCSNSNGVFDPWDWTKSLYTQPGVREPIINPISGRQFLPQNDGQTRRERAKAIMSYACFAFNNNTFFEPVDLVNMKPGLFPFVQAFIDIDRPQVEGSPAAAPAAPGATAASSRAPSPTPRPNPGPRLHVSGTVDTTAGDIFAVEAFGDNGPVTPSYDTDYLLVQLDAAGNELSRVGLFAVKPEEHGQTELTPAFFAATVVARPGVSKIELRRGEQILDQFLAGAASPVVQIAGPLAGSAYNAGEIPVTFSASDGDGDALSIIVEYSANAGATWIPIASASQSGTIQVPVTLLAGSAGASRVRVTASDGLHRASATSGDFSVAAQPPQPYISHAELFETSLEGQAFTLSGSASDNQDGTIADANLRWSSSVDGDLGAGRSVSALLVTPGWHIITLQATNSLGLTATATHTVYVYADYDHDSISDDWELIVGLNPLDSHDVQADADGDGLSYLVEVGRGSDPNQPDSDTDGWTDDQEIVNGTNPMSSDNPLADTLVVDPSTIEVSVDLADDAPLPQRTIGVFSRGVADWSVTASVDWLEASAISGTTPGSLLLRVQAHELADGAHTAALYFESAALGQTVTVPLTIAVSNRAAWFDVSGDGQANGNDCASVQSLVGTSEGETRYDFHYDIDRDGVIENSDVGTCQAAVTTTLPGDFDHDGDMDDYDIDLFIPAPFIDFNSDFQLDAADSRYLIETIFHTHFGDTNLDGFVNRADAAIVTRNLGWAGGAAWARGNFNGDARVDILDLAIQQTNFGRGSAPSAGAASPAAPEALVMAETSRFGRPAQQHEATATLRVGRQNLSSTRVKNTERVINPDGFGHVTQLVPTLQVEGVARAPGRPRGRSRIALRPAAAIVDNLLSQS